MEGLAARYAFAFVGASTSRRLAESFASIYTGVGSGHVVSHRPVDYSTGNLEVMLLGPSSRMSLLECDVEAASRVGLPVCAVVPGVRMMDLSACSPVRTPIRLTPWASSILLLSPSLSHLSLPFPSSSCLRLLSRSCSSW